MTLAVEKRMPSANLAGNHNAMREINDTEWAEFAARRPGLPFFIAVLSTGIFCRSGCPARTPKRANVRVTETAEEAGAAGFRPCLKCRPLGPDPLVAAVVSAARAIEADPAAPWDVPSLAEAAGMNDRALRRAFRQVLGTPPLKFRDAVRLRRFKLGLRRGEGVTASGYDAGYSGPAARHQAAAELGMTPSDYATGGQGVEIEVVVVPTALGSMVLAATARGICYLRFDDTDDPLADLRREFPKATIAEAAADGVTAAHAIRVAAFLQEGGPRPDLPLDLFGTAFQLKVWEALTAIPTGEVRTYGELAKGIGHPGAARAVGSANARNRVAVLVPCHLVVAGGGKLGGYAGGLDRKRKLLALEGI